jgi:hypothetical protein
MPTHDSVGLHDDQGRSPILPRLGEQDPKHSIARAEVRTLDRALEDCQLLTQRHVLERDGSVFTTEQPERSKQNEKRGQHALSCRPIDLRINRRGWRSHCGDPQAPPFAGGNVWVDFSAITIARRDPDTSEWWSG